MEEQTQRRLQRLQQEFLDAASALGEIQLTITCDPESDWRVNEPGAKEMPAFDTLHGLVVDLVETLNSAKIDLPAGTSR